MIIFAQPDDHIFESRHTLAFEVEDGTTQHLRQIEHLRIHAEARSRGIITRGQRAAILSATTRLQAILSHLLRAALYRRFAKVISQQHANRNSYAVPHRGKEVQLSNRVYDWLHA